MYLKKSRNIKKYKETAKFNNKLEAKIMLIIRIIKIQRTLKYTKVSFQL